MILFIASMIIAASVAGVFTSSVGDLSQAIDDQGLQVSDDVRTDIEIISDNGTGAPVYSGDNITLLVKNTGSRQLPADADQIDVLVDGQFQPSSDVYIVEVFGDGESWNRGDVIKLNTTVGANLGAGDHRVKLIMSSDEEVFQFNIPQP
jgi:flagellar protein FlaG